MAKWPILHTLGVHVRKKGKGEGPVFLQEGRSIHRHERVTERAQKEEGGDKKGGPDPRE